MSNRNSRVRLFGAALMVFSLSLAAAWQTNTRHALADKLPRDASQPPVMKEQALENYGKLPLAFEPNLGQADAAVKYISRGSGYALYLTGNEAVMSLTSGKKQSAWLKLKLVGANAAPQVEAQDQLAGKNNYLSGSDRSQWQTDVPTYGKVLYREVWPGIDMVWYGNQRTLEYDFIVKPGADPQSIRLKFEGADKLHLDAAGNLVLTTGGGEVTQHAPVVYQESEQGRKMIAGKYVLAGNHEVGFQLGVFDLNRPLVIDPQLAYSSYFGGQFSDNIVGVAVDGSGFIYIAGRTTSANFPTLNSFQAPTNSPNVFVAKLNPTDLSRVYCTVFPGESISPEAIAVTNDGRACVTGIIDADTGNNGSFPLTDNRYQDAKRFLGWDDAFVTMLNQSGNGLVYSTYFGGTVNYISQFSGVGGNDAGHGIAVSDSNLIYVVGSTFTNDLPTRHAFQSINRDNFGGEDAFIAVFNPVATNRNDTLVYASFLGGRRADKATAVAVDNAGNAYVVGSTASDDLNVASPSGQSLPPFRASFQGGATDAFVAKIDPNTNGNDSLVYLTYFGGNGTDRAEAVAVDASQRAYVTGATGTPNTGLFPLLNAFDTTQENGEAFVAKFNANGTAIFYSSYLGGNNTPTGFEEGLGIALDQAENVYVTGRTSAGTTFPTGAVAPPFPAELQGSSFIAKIQATASTATPPRLLYATRFRANVIEGIALDAKGNVYLGGTTGNGLPVTPDAFQSTFQGGTADGFLVKIGSTFPDTIGVFRPSATDVLLRNSNTAGNADITLNFGLAGDIAIAGDWDGDGIDTPGVFRPSTGQFILRRNNSPFCPIPAFCSDIIIHFGQFGDLPVVGDWNGDGIDTPGVFRNGLWLLTNGINGQNVNNTAPPINFTFAFGGAGDLPVTGDWNGDGLDTIGVFRVGANILTNKLADFDPVEAFTFSFGGAGDLPVSGDWDGDGVDTIGVFRNNFGFILTNRLANFDATEAFTVNFGVQGDQPLAGDWNRLP